MPKALIFQTVQCTNIPLRRHPVKMCASWHTLAPTSFLCRFCCAHHHGPLVGALLNVPEHHCQLWYTCCEAECTWQRKAWKLSIRNNTLAYLQVHISSHKTHLSVHMNMYIHVILYIYSTSEVLCSLHKKHSIQAKQPLVQYRLHRNPWRVLTLQVESSLPASTSLPIASAILTNIRPLL